MAKALKASRIHRSVAPKPARIEQAKKRPELVVVKSGHPTPVADGGARKLQGLVRKAIKSGAKGPRQTRKTVEILSADGCVLAAYTLVLEQGALDAEFEEAALILAETDGLAAPEIRARRLP